MGSQKPVRESRDVSQPRARHFHILARSRRSPPPLASVRQSAPALFRSGRAPMRSRDSREETRSLRGRRLPRGKDFRLTSRANRALLTLAAFSREYVREIRSFDHRSHRWTGVIATRGNPLSRRTFELTFINPPSPFAQLSRNKLD